MRYSHTVSQVRLGHQEKKTGHR